MEYAPYFLSFCLLLTINSNYFINAEVWNDSDNAANTLVKDETIIADLRKQIKKKELELENAEGVNKNFERILQLVNILGQVDTFLTDRTKTMFKKLAILAEDDPKYRK